MRAHPNAPALDDGAEVLTYRECWLRVICARKRLLAAGVTAGTRVGVRLPSGRNEVYVAILAVLACGASYVPVDFDDPDERAEVVWQEAGVLGVLEGEGRWRARLPGARAAGGPRARVTPEPGDEAWIIFTSGSTGRPKGVAITHRSAAAFIDAEAGLFLTARPVGPNDRVLAGLSVAFDASCEEMWLAWRHGACLVPAPRALVRGGAELGPWLARRGITVVSTVPTLAALWPAEALGRVRLLILGGEACPAELAGRLSGAGRELWNTYGPTETAVVACAARLDQGGPVRIGLPLAGWLLAVLGPDGLPVRPGEIGELVIAGVGMGRYLDSAKDAEKFQPVPALGWSRAYRTGDIVRADPEGLVFIGRADDQVKVGGRRIELGEIEAALLALPGVTAAVAAVRATATGGDVLVGYVVLAPSNTRGSGGRKFDSRFMRAALANSLPGGLIPHLVVLDALPMRTSGKVDRDSLPWPLAEPGGTHGDSPGDGGPNTDSGTVGWLARTWHELLGVPIGWDSDFFDLGATSLGTAKLVTRLRQRYPEATVADVYQHSGLTELASRLDALNGERPSGRAVHPTPLHTGFIQALLLVGLFAVRGLRWLLALATFCNLAALAAGQSVVGAPVPWMTVILGWVVLVSPPGRLLAVALAVRWLCTGVQPGCYPRGGAVHLRIWAAQRLAAEFGMGLLAGTPLAACYARLLGCEVGRDVELRSEPPVSGLATLGDGCAIEPEVDLAGWWLEGDMLHVGSVHVGSGARVGARSTLMPGAVVGPGAEIEAGSCVHGEVPAQQRWSGVPARHLGTAGEGWPAPARRRAGWAAIYTATLAISNMLPLLAALPAALFTFVLSTDQWLDPDDPLTVAPLGLVTALSYALLVAGSVRLASLGVRPGVYPLDSPAGWSAWLVDRLVTTARTALFPLYASLATPWWFRMLGAHVGRRTEISTTTGLPTLMNIEDGAFLADDTLIAPAEMRGGWVRLGRSQLGRRAFAGNSSIVGPGKNIADDSLIAVLSFAPHRLPPNSSWIGRPPFELPRVADVVDPRRTFDPPRRLVLARAGIEALRAGPWLLSTSLGTIVLFALSRIQLILGWGAAAILAGPLVLAAGIAALAFTTAVKWLLIGRFREGEHPLWSAFVWRNELFDAFCEVLAMPWLGNCLLGTPMLNLWLRGLGAQIGKGVWCESHWLPETDLVHLADGATINRGCVLQTHLFHDRLMRIDHVRLGAGATLGPHSILLPGASVGAGASVGDLSLVMRGEHIPERTRWLGNPIATWPEHLNYPNQPTGRGKHFAIATPRANTATTRHSFAYGAAITALAACALGAPILLIPSAGDTAPLSTPTSPSATRPSGNSQTNIGQQPPRVAPPTHITTPGTQRHTTAHTNHINVPGT